MEFHSLFEYNELNVEYVEYMSKRKERTRDRETETDK